jgi:hypothetical protein
VLHAGIQQLARAVHIHVVFKIARVRLARGHDGRQMHHHVDVLQRDGLGQLGRADVAGQVVHLRQAHGRFAQVVRDDKRGALAAGQRRQPCHHLAAQVATTAGDQNAGVGQRHFAAPDQGASGRGGRFFQ